MIIVQLHLVKNEGIMFLHAGGIVVGAAGSLPAFWAQVRVGSGAMGLDRGVGVVIGAG